VSDWRPFASPASKNAMTFNARAQIVRVIGVDLVAVMGLSAITMQTIISEIGTDMERFPTIKHFCSWLIVSPCVVRLLKLFLKERKPL
jgi:hypothetical protein